MDQFDAVKEVAMGGARRIGEGFTRPDDDWAPVLIVGGARPVTAGLDLDDKDAMAHAISEIIREHEAEAAALVTSGWQSSDPAAASGTMRASEDPERVEILTVAVMDAERAEWWCAEITRYEEAPPVLGDWEMLSPTASGRFPDAMRHGFEAVA